MKRIASLVVCSGIVLVWAAGPARGQSSSMMRTPPPVPTHDAVVLPDGTPGEPAFAAMPPEPLTPPATRAIEQASFIAIAAVPPRKFKVHDLISIIVRQQKKYEADSKLDTKKEWDINGKLKEWFRFYPDHKLGTDKLSNGQPGFDFEYQNELKSNGKAGREDTFITRIQAEVIDVKPNGNLVLEARTHQKHGEEQFTLTLTGVCRSEDITADNSVLSTQIAELELIEENKGAVNDATRRGWIPKLIDWVKPF